MILHEPRENASKNQRFQRIPRAAVECLRCGHMRSSPVAERDTDCSLLLLLRRVVWTERVISRCLTLPFVRSIHTNDAR